MKIRYDNSQDLTFWLADEEKEKLLNGPTEFFGGIHETSIKPDKTGRYYILLRGLCKELNCCMFLGYCLNEMGIFSKGEDNLIYELDENMGKINIPNQNELPWKINLSERGVEHLRRGWRESVRYDGEHKLFIIRESN